MLKNKLLLIALFLLYGCSAIDSLDNVLSDNRNKYQKSNRFPDLEVPPDLITEALDDPLTIPGEETADTFSEFQRRKSIRQGEQLITGELALLSDSDEQSLIINQAGTTVWPELREFWLARDFILDIDDAELGVIETKFRDSMVDGVEYREKFKMLLESRVPNQSIVFLSGEQQKKVPDDNGLVDWVDETNETKDKQLITELKLLFNKTLPITKAASQPAEDSTVPENLSQHPVATEDEYVEPVTATRSPELMAEIVAIDNNINYLEIPGEFHEVWEDMGKVLEKAGIATENEDRNSGIYLIIYPPIVENKDNSILADLAFWKSDDNSSLFKISLTDVGNKTEVVVLDESDNWSDSEYVTDILDTLQNIYNSTSDF